MKNFSKTICLFLNLLASLFFLSCISDGSSSYGVPYALIPPHAMTITVLQGNVRISGSVLMNENATRSTTKKKTFDDYAAVQGVTQIPDEIVNEGETYTYKIPYGGSATIQIQPTNDVETVIICSDYNNGKRVTIPQNGGVGIMVYYSYQ